MSWSAAFFLSSILLGVGLAMDAFAVSLANGLNETNMSLRKHVSIAGTFGFFQALMPMTGWVCVHLLLEAFSAIQPYIPWVAFVLLAWIGGRMIWEGIKKKPDSGEAGGLSAGGLLVQGIATSIDALSVGFAIAAYSWQQALVSALIIAAVTFGISWAGVRIGRSAGTRLAGRASILGGVILVLIGLEVLLR